MTTAATLHKPDPAELIRSMVQDVRAAVADPDHLYQSYCDMVAPLQAELDAIFAKLHRFEDFDVDYRICDALANEAAEIEAEILVIDLAFEGLI